MEKVARIILSRIQGEPAATAWLVHTLLVCGMAFGLRMTTTQLAALDISILAMLQWIVRQNVSPINGRPVV